MAAVVHVQPHGRTCAGGVPETRSEGLFQIDSVRVGTAAIGLSGASEGLPDAALVPIPDLPAFERHLAVSEAVDLHDGQTG